MPTLYKPKPSRRRAAAEVGRYADRRKVYDSAVWKRIREGYLMAHPVSEISEWLGQTNLTEHVHHIISFLDVPESERELYAYDTNNLIAVTAEEHWRLHNGDLRGCTSKEEIKARVLRINKGK